MEDPIWNIRPPKEVSTSKGGRVPERLLTELSRYSDPLAKINVFFFGPSFAHHATGSNALGRHATSMADSRPHSGKRNFLMFFISLSRRQLMATSGTSRREDWESGVCESVVIVLVLV